MIKYLGSKRTLIPHLLRAIGALPDVRTVVDLFSGTARVGHALKRAGYRVIANDHNAYAATLARCYVEADAEPHAAAAQRVIDELRRLPGRAGYFTDTFCLRSRFFHPRNGERIDAIRERIEAMALDEPLRSVVLVSLMEAADRVDSTTGVQMAYLKSYAPRALTDLELRVPALLPQPASGPCEAHQLDALAAAARLSARADAAYLDPPYNQHSYLGNYHIWETLVRWDKAAVYGRACKRIDCRTRKSPFNSRRQAADALSRLIDAVRSPHLLVSFNDEGFLTRDQIESMLSRGRAVRSIELDYKRYVGAQIGIYNPDGVKVGTPGKLRNTEVIYAASPGRTAGAAGAPVVAGAGAVVGA